MKRTGVISWVIPIFAFAAGLPSCERQPRAATGESGTAASDVDGAVGEPSASESSQLKPESESDSFLVDYEPDPACAISEPIPEAFSSLREIFEDSRKRMTSLIEQGQSAGEDAVALIVRADTILRQDRAAMAQELGSDKSFHYASTADRSLPQEIRDKLRERIENLEKSEVGSIISRIADTQHVALRVSNSMVPDHHEPLLLSKSVVGFNKGRAVLAAMRHDNTAFSARVREMLALGRIVSTGGNMLSCILAMQTHLEALSLVELRLAITANTDQSLESLDHLFREIQIYPVSRTFHAELIQLNKVCALSYFLGDRYSEVLQTPISEDLWNAKPAMPEGEGYVYDTSAGQVFLDRPAHHQLIRIGIQAWACKALKPTSARSGSTEAAIIERCNMIPSIGKMSKAFTGLIQAYDIYLAQRTGTLTLIAIERYRLAHGKPPDQLADLVPQYLPTEPVDPFTGNTLGYRVAKQSALEKGREFDLYAAGPDGVDDGGIDFQTNGLSPEPGKDLLINR